jgi:hypothetical protein
MTLLDALRSFGNNNAVANAVGEPKGLESLRLFGNNSNDLVIDGKRLPPVATRDSPDYNLAAYIAKYGVPDQSKGQHLTDEFKLPNHMTFSDQSVYSNPNVQGGKWEQGGADTWAFTPSSFNMAQHSPAELSDYFKTREKQGTFLNLPDGKMIEGTRHQPTSLADMLRMNKQ